MPTSTTLRLTTSGACAACGYYPGIYPHPNCQPDLVRPRKLGSSRRARVDARFSAVARNHLRYQNALARSW